jgi:hypothetical protein
MGRRRYLCAAGARGVFAPSFSELSKVAAIAALLFCLCAAACTTDGSPALTTATPRASVAFEQIDGPPEAVFHRLVRELSHEAAARQIAVVPRAQTAQFRIRGYVAARTRGDRTAVVWVWDVYDADQKRTLRISGEEDAGHANGDAWAGTDDQVLRRISRASMDRLVAFLATPPLEAQHQDTPVHAAVAEESGPERQHVYNLAASSDEFAPEAFGIVRLSNTDAATRPADPMQLGHSTGADADVPLPKRQPGH